MYNSIKITIIILYMSRNITRRNIVYPTLLQKKKEEQFIKNNRHHNMMCANRRNSASAIDHCLILKTLLSRFIGRGIECTTIITSSTQSARH